MPIRDDHPAKGIGGGKGHEGKRIQRGAPQEGIHAKPTATAAIFLALLGARPQNGDTTPVPDPDVARKSRSRLLSALYLSRPTSQSWEEGSLPQPAKPKAAGQKVNVRAGKAMIR